MAPSVTLKVELPVAVLLRLLSGGHLGAAEMQCLDMPSRVRLRRLCLDSCKDRGPHDAAGPMRCEL
jgi:hypothetical protein